MEPPYARPTGYVSGRADFRNHGLAHVRFRRPNGYPLLGRGTYVAADGNDPDVLADECLPFVALAEADVQPEKLHRPDRAAAFEPSQPTNALRTLAALACIRAGAAAPPYSVPATCEYDGSSASRAANPVILYPFGPALAAGRGGQRWPERGMTRGRHGGKRATVVGRLREFRGGAVKVGCWHQA